MNCPRCSTELSPVTIESCQVQACPNCEGTWYPDEALGNVTDQTFTELKKTGLGASLVPDQLAKIDLDEPVHCPQCSKLMSRYTYSMACKIVLDECPEHGVWLDDGELGTLMQYLTDLDKKVGSAQEDLLNARNVGALEELSKSATFYSLPGNVLATINAAYSRDRSEDS